ncbi:MAG TPA: ATP-binding protein [Longimicrobiales bacterium]|nr:ATP-binding protein [Longimicrobiales bacterium]
MTQGAQVQEIAAALREAREEIARRWLERIAARVAVDKHFVFPSEDLLDEVPVLIEGIARHLGGDDDEISVNTPVVMKARELGRLRHAQGFSGRQILWEYEVLGAVILQWLDELDEAVSGAALPEPLVRRLFRALAAVQRATMDEFLANFEDRIIEREDRLRSFNRALSHELKNEVGAILGAARMMREDFVVADAALRERFVTMILDNGEKIERLLQNLVQLTHIDLDSRRQRNVLLPHAATEVARQLRGYAEAHGVRVEVAEDLPPLEVNGAAVDLCLSNLVANGIKYCDPAKADRWVRVRVGASGRDAQDACVIVEVADNGRGVPEFDRPRLFERFFRSDNTVDVEGTGLGLSLVRDAVERVGGRIWADFPESGETVFVFTLPARREADPA